MQVLVTSLSTAGHVHPLLPLSLALHRRGHSVLCATHPEAHAGIARHGLPTAAAGLSDHDRRARLASTFGIDMAAVPHRQRSDVMFPYGFGAVAMPAMADDLRRITSSWRPDVVLHDAAELAAPLVAAEHGVRHVTHSYGTTVPLRRAAAAGDATRQLWDSAGVAQPPYAGLFADVYIDIRPPSLPGHPPDTVDLLRERPTSADAVGGTLPPVAVATDERPLVYVTFGTVFNDPDVVRIVLDAVTKLDVRVLVTLGHGREPRALEPVPANVHVTTYVPQHAVLPRCDLVVSHAGSGTFLGAMSHGLPQLCLPQGADQFLNAEAAQHLGAGLALGPEDLEPGAIAGAVCELLKSPTYRRTAEGIAAEIAAMPTADQVADRLEDLVG